MISPVYIIEYHCEAKQRRNFIKISNMKMSLIIGKFKNFFNTEFCRANQPPQTKWGEKRMEKKSHDKNPSYKVRDFISFQYEIYVMVLVYSNISPSKYINT